MGQFLIDWLGALWMVLVESGPYLLVGFIIAGVLSILVPSAWIARRLGGDDVKSVATAALIGVPVPLCSCSVIPTATQLRRSGASRGATTSFLISTPETGVDSIGATWALMDPLMTVVRPVAAFLTAFASGIAVNLFGAGESGPLDQASLKVEPAAVDAGSDDGSCCGHVAAPEPAKGTSTEGDHGHVDHDHAAHDDAEAPAWKRVLSYAFGTLLDDLTPWFLIGFAISGLIVVAIPDGFFAGAVFTGWAAMAAMLVAGVPLYVCATASTPIAAAMMAKGLEPGAALVFLLAGPATNVATILVVRDLLGKRALVIYLTSIAVMSLAIGAAVNRLYPMFGLDPTDMDVTPGAMDHGFIATASGVILAVLLARSALRLRLDVRLGKWLRKVGGPIGLDLTARPAKVAAGSIGLVAYAMTAVTAVGPAETVFVESFGKIAAQSSEPGLLTHLPWPFSRAVRIDTGTIRLVTFGVDETPIPDSAISTESLIRANKRFAKLDDEAEMMTGEETFVAVEYAVQYRVTDGEAWHFGFSDPEALVKRLAQEAIRRSTAKRTVQQLLVTERGGYVDEVEVTLAALLQQSGLGAELRSIQLLSAHAPPNVHGAYRAVASALIDRETKQLIETRKAAEKLSEASIAKTQLIQAAKAERQSMERGAQSAADGLSALIKANEETDGVASQALQLNALRRALTGAQDVSRRIVAVLAPFTQIQTFPARGPSGTPPSPMGQGPFGR